MERLKISPYARRTARELGVDPSALTGTGPNGRIVWRDVDAAAKRPPAQQNVGQAAGLYTSASVSELLAGLETLGGALPLTAFVEQAVSRLAPLPVAVRYLGGGVEGGAPCLRAGERAVLAFGAPAGERLRLYLGYAPSALEDEVAAAFLGDLRAVLENPLTLLL